MLFRSQRDADFTDLVEGIESCSQLPTAAHGRSVKQMSEAAKDEMIEGLQQEVEALKQVLREFCGCVEYLQKG